jgi:hypothetical protein
MGSGPRVMRRVEAGDGEPAVALEAGLGNGAASWQRVMPLLAPHMRQAQAGADAERAMVRYQ